MAGEMMHDEMMHDEMMHDEDEGALRGLCAVEMELAQAIAEITDGGVPADAMVVVTQAIGRAAARIRRRLSDV